MMTSKSYDPDQEGEAFSKHMLSPMLIYLAKNSGSMAAFISFEALHPGSALANWVSRRVISLTRGV